ncbi:MAG TPA: hypothetical protein ENH60_04730, partial [Pricia sp.]|nr:hypothetical protein [Pricia sp.]
DVYKRQALRYLLKDSKIPYTLKIAFYILCALLFILLYSIDERVMLIAFIVISAYHFGEERSAGLDGFKGTKRLLWSFAYGSSIFLLLFYTNFSEFNQVIEQFGFHGVQPEYLQRLIVPCLIGQTLLLLGSCVLGRIPVFKTLLIFVELVSLFVLFRMLGILAGFTLYFIFWHSIPSIRTQIALRKNKGETFDLLTFSKQSLPVYLLSAATALISVYYFQNGMISLEYLVIFIACTTMPHVLVMAMFEKN